MFQQCLHYDCNNRNNAGYCKTTMCINPMYSKIGTAQYGQGVQKQIITNADRIRNMTDEELARFFDLEACLFPWCDMSCGDVEEIPCRQCMLKWLKQEADK